MNVPKCFRFLAICILFLTACAEDEKKESDAQEKARKLTDELIEDMEAKEDSTTNYGQDSLK